MLHAASQAGGIPGPYQMQLHRERMLRRARLQVPVTPPKIYDPAIFLPAEILVYPTHVFADDCDQPFGKGSVIRSASRIREIQDLICRNLKLSRADLLSVRRDRYAVMARHIAMYLCKVHTPNSLPDLGLRFGGRDHTTVLNGVRRIEATMASPMGTGVSQQWPVDACDMVRDIVNLAEVTIATWGNDRTARARYPSRSGR